MIREFRKLTEMNELKHSRAQPGMNLDNSTGSPREATGVKNNAAKRYAKKSRM